MANQMIHRLLLVNALLCLVAVVKANHASQCAEACSVPVSAPSESLLQVQHQIQPKDTALRNDRVKESKEPKDTVSRNDCVKESKEVKKTVSRNAKPYSCMEQQVEATQDDGVLVIIPGFGDRKRMPLVKKNLEWLKAQGVPFECKMYVYRSEEDFPLNSEDFKPCEILRRPGWWLSHVLHLPLNESTKPWVLHMIDGVEVNDNVSLKEIFSIMRSNNLGHASPTFAFSDAELNQHGRNLAKYGVNIQREFIGRFTYYTMMERHLKNKIGRSVDFIELHINVFSRKYFACLQDNIDADNTLGWGMDAMLPGLCGGSLQQPEVDAGNLGLLDHMTMRKKFGGSYDYKKATDAYTRYVMAHPNIRVPKFVAKGELRGPEDV